MKSFFATAVIAAIVFAAEDEAVPKDEPAEQIEAMEWEREYSNFKDDVEDFYRDLGRALDDIVDGLARNPAEWAEDMQKDAQREIEREIERTMEDLECTMADINGDGTCPKRDRERKMDECWQQDGMTWDWDSQQCMTYEERDAMEEKRCTDDGHVWMPLREGWSPECYRGEPWQDCMMQGDDMEFNYDTQTCMTRKANCEAQGQTWNEDEWGGWCEWKWLKKLGAEKSRAVSKVLERKPLMKHTLLDYSVSLDFDKFSSIWEPVKDGHISGAEMLDDMFAQWGPSLESWAEDQKRKEEAALCKIAAELGDNVLVGGEPLSSKMPPLPCDGENELVMSLKKTKNVRKAIMSSTKPSGTADITFTGPSEEEWNALMDKWGEEVEAIGKKIEEVTEEFRPKYEELDKQLAEAMETNVKPSAEAFVGGVMEEVKPWWESFNVQVTNGEMALAKKQAAAAASSKKSNAGFYAGLSFGVLGVVASAAVIAACNKKKTTQECEETLL